MTIELTKSEISFLKTELLDLKLVYLDFLNNYEYLPKLEETKKYKSNIRYINKLLKKLDNNE